MRAQDEEADNFGVVFLEDLPDREEVAERLRHFFFGDPNEAVMHPVVHKLAVMGALGLRDLVLVVGKLQILTAAVNVEVLAEQVGTHRRALDMPPGAAIAPRRRPERLVLAGMFPEHEVERVVLGAVDLDAFASPQVVDRFAGKLAVARELAHRKVHVAVPCW
jgi:hypothetical protein